jgi:serine/threonine protein kinase
MAKRRFKEFKLGKVVGVGTVGTIYRARDLTNKKDVALKVLLPTVSEDPLILARFARETLILEKLSHPNIVRYYGGGRTGEQLFFVAMELLEGGSLKDELDRSGAFTCLETITCGIQVCSALQHAHNHGVIHRDLKPSNLIFDDDGHLKLVDFGIARDTHSADITSRGLTVGSYAYMAPELIRGERIITGQVDLYALGCLLFELLTGRTPFLGTNFAELFNQHLASEPPSARSSNASVPERLDDIVRQLMQKTPDQRPLNARNVQGQLLQLIDQQLDKDEVSNDVSAREVLDRGRQMLAKRIQKRQRSVSWLTVAGIFAIAAAIVYAASKLN